MGTIYVQKVKRLRAKGVVIVGELRASIAPPKQTVGNNRPTAVGVSPTTPLVTYPHNNIGTEYSVDELGPS